jgi:hypothetical protein
VPMASGEAAGSEFQALLPSEAAPAAPLPSEAAPTRKRNRSPLKAPAAPAAAAQSDIALRVCRSVEERQQATYSLVADDVVAELTRQTPNLIKSSHGEEERNVRR